MKLIFFRAIVLLSFVSALVACGDGAVLNKNQNSNPGTAQTFNLTKVSQRTLRYDCHDHVSSDQIEVESAPRQWVSILPKTTVNFYRTTVTNQARNRSITVGGYAFWIDGGNGELSMWVSNGSNKLDYSFSYCDKLQVDDKGQSTGECANTPTVQETGTLYVNVVYSEQTLDGENKIHPDPQSCAGSSGQ